MDGVPLSLQPRAGHVWVRTSRVGGRLVIQLVDYRAQPDDRWNVARVVPGACRGVTLTVRVVGARPRVWFGYHEGGPQLEPLEAPSEGDTVVLSVPDFRTWFLVVVDG